MLSDQVRLEFLRNCASKSTSSHICGNCNSRSPLVQQIFLLEVPDNCYRLFIHLLFSKISDVAGEFVKIGELNFCFLLSCGGHKCAWRFMCAHSTVEITHKVLVACNIFARLVFRFNELKNLQCPLTVWNGPPWSLLLSFSSGDRSLVKITARIVPLSGRFLMCLIPDKATDLGPNPPVLKWTLTEIWLSADSRLNAKASTELAYFSLEVIMLILKLISKSIISR